MVAKAMATLVGAVSSVAVTVFKVWFIFKGWIGAIKVLGQWLGMLPPKLRILVGGLLVLGASGKAGAFALGILAKGARVAALAFSALSLPVIVLVNPMAALRSASLLLGQALLMSGRMAAAAGRMFYSVGAAVGSVAGAIGGKLLSVLKSGVTGFAVLTAASAAWGIKLASKAETATVVFGTMLKDMNAGKALMSQLEGWAGAPLFDPEQIQLSGTLLFKAGIAAKDVVGKLDQLGQVAAATKTPLDELARIYQQGMNQGAFQQDKINQLSDRGIAIYEGLTHATGKSGAALKEMIRDGKIGPAEMNAALAHLTTGQGIYAGAINNIAQTTGGMWSILMNKVGMAARELGINIMTAFDFKGLMTQATGIFTNLKTQIASMLPLFQAWAIYVRAAFTAVGEIVSVVFGSIGSFLGVTSSNWMTTFLEMAAIATWAVQQWPDIATLAFVNIALAVVRFGADWQATFVDAARIVVTVFKNIGSNIKTAMKEIWDYIASGGRNKMQFAFKPLMDGFQQAARKIGPIEADLAATSERLGQSLGSSLGAAIETNMKLMADFEAGKNAPAPTLDGAHAPSATPGGDGTDAGGKNSRTNFAVDSLNKGSEAALKAVYASMGGDKVQDAQLKQQTQMTKHLSVIAKNSTTSRPMVQGAVT